MNKKYITETIVISIVIAFICYNRFFGIPNWVHNIKVVSNEGFIILLLEIIVLFICIFQISKCYKGRKIRKVKLTLIIILIVVSFTFSYATLNDDLFYS